MEHRSSECMHEKLVKMLPATQVLGVGGGRRKRTDVLSGMIVWNLLVLVLLVMAVCVQGRGGAIPSNTSAHLALRRSTQDKNVKEAGVGSLQAAKSAGNPTLSPQSSQNSDSVPLQDSKTTPKNAGRPEEKGGGEGEASQGGGGVTQPISENKAGNANCTSNENSENGSLPSHIPSMSTEAVFRAFCVFVGVGAILLIYIVIKLIRLRRRRAPGKYRVLSHTDDQEMFPLAAGDGEDEEIFNAAHHLPRK